MSSTTSNVTISELTDYGFTITAVARSGNVFTIRGRDGITTRTCTPAGVRGCPHTGRW